MRLRAMIRRITDVLYRPLAAAVLTILLFSVPPGCTREPVKLYAGPDRPAEETAVLRSGWGTFITSIDGQSHFRAAILLPGQHRIVAIEDRGCAASGHTTYIEFDAEPGQFYRIETQRRRSRASVWIVDEGTGKIVAGSKPD